MNYSNPSINLSDGITEYITTNEDGSDSTQYLSVLSQDLSLQEMNVTLTTDKVVENNEETNQPFIFTVDGTNEIYGVQVAQDDDGNLRKYQIQYRYLNCYFYVFGFAFICFSFNVFYPNSLLGLLES